MSNLLTAEKLEKIYHSAAGSLRAVDGFSYAFEEKKSYAIIGKSGSGKSTLLHMLGGLEMPDGGKVLYKGEDIYAWNDEKQAEYRRRQMGFVFQQFNLIPELTVRQNIEFPLKLDHRKMDMALYKSVMEQLGLTEKDRKYPSELSGGEQQRVAIARSVITKPQILFADEPTGSLDKRTGEDTMQLMFGMAKAYGQTLILVTHDMDVAGYADHIITIQDGELKE